MSCVDGRRRRSNGSPDPDFWGFQSVGTLTVLTGPTVTLCFKRGPDVAIAEGNDVVYVRMPKRLARELAEKARRAANAPESGCKDADAHFHGHCGCK